MKKRPALPVSDYLETQLAALQTNERPLESQADWKQIIGPAIVEFKQRNSANAKGVNQIDGLYMACETPAKRSELYDLLIEPTNNVLRSKLEGVWIGRLRSAEDIAFLQSDPVVARKATFTPRPRESNHSGPDMSVYTPAARAAGTRAKAIALTPAPAAAATHVAEAAEPVAETLPAPEKVALPQPTTPEPQRPAAVIKQVRPARTQPEKPPAIARPPAEEAPAAPLPVANDTPATQARRPVFMGPPTVFTHRVDHKKNPGLATALCQTWITGEDTIEASMPPGIDRGARFKTTTGAQSLGLKIKDLRIDSHQSLDSLSALILSEEGGRLPKAERALLVENPAGFLSQIEKGRRLPSHNFLKLLWEVTDRPDVALHRKQMIFAQRHNLQMDMLQPAPDR